MNTVIILLLSVLLAAGVYAAMSVHMGKKVVFHHRRSSAYTLGQGILQEDFPLRLLELPWEAFEVETEDGLTLRGRLLDLKVQRTAVFCHGITWTRYGMFKYLEPFLEGNRDGRQGASWNIVLYDHRAHGESDGDYPTFGAYEKNDLACVVKMVRSRWSGTRTLLYGESMGSAIILQYLGKDQEIHAAVVDCPFNTLSGELRHQLKVMGTPEWLHAPLMRGARVYVKWKAGYDITLIDPQKAALTSKCPILICHGGADDYVPTRMSEELYRARSPIAPTRLHITPEADHAESIRIDRQSYLRAVRDFLDEYFPLKGR